MKKDDPSRTGDTGEDENEEDEEKDVDADEERTDKPQTFGLFPVVDEPIRTRLLDACRSLLQRATPQQVHDLAYLIYAIQRLPLVTRGIHAGIDLVTRHGESAGLRHVTITPDELSLSSGESINAGFGTDHESYAVLEVGTDEMRDMGYGEDFTEWLSAFCDQAGEGNTEFEIWCEADDDVNPMENIEGIPWTDNPLLDDMSW